jgi:hypothetical protein
MWWSAEDYAELNWRFDKDGRRIWAPCGIIPVAALWFDSPDFAAQQAIGRQMQLQAFVDLPYIPLGQYFTDTAYQRGLTGQRRGIVLPLNVRWS